MVYAGFWRRFCALWLDFIFLFPTVGIVWWGGENFRLFNLYYFVPETLFSFFYGVYLVRRFGGTPGKRIMKLRITRVDGTSVDYREALLRYLPEALLAAASSVALIIAVLNLTDAEYFSATFLERSRIINAAAPSWNLPVTIMLNVWIWGEFFVMLTNKKRRALHDFIAGTVVIRDMPKEELRTKG